MKARKGCVSCKHFAKNVLTAFMKLHL